MSPGCSASSAGDTEGVAGDCQVLQLGAVGEETFKKEVANTRVLVASVWKLFCIELVLVALALQLSQYSHSTMNQQTLPVDFWCIHTRPLRMILARLHTERRYH